MKAKSRMSNSHVKILLKLRPHSLNELIEKGVRHPCIHFCNLSCMGVKIKSVKKDGIKHYYIKENK